jgi:hypothetical protein
MRASRKLWLIGKRKTREQPANDAVMQRRSAYAFVYAALAGNFDFSYSCSRMADKLESAPQQATTHGPSRQNVRRLNREDQ